MASNYLSKSVLNSFLLLPFLPYPKKKLIPVNLTLLMVGCLIVTSQQPWKVGPLSLPSNSLLLLLTCEATACLGREVCDKMKSTRMPISRKWDMLSIKASDADIAPFASWTKVWNSEYSGTRTVKVVFMHSSNSAQKFFDVQHILNLFRLVFISCICAIVLCLSFF